MSRQNGAAAHGTAPRNAREFAGFSLCGGEGFCRRLRAAESWERGTLLKRVRPGARKISERVSFCSHARLCRMSPRFWATAGFSALRLRIPARFCAGGFSGFALLCAANSAKGGISAFRERRIRGARGSAIPSICPRPVSRKLRRYRRLKLSTPPRKFRFAAV